uniref:Selenoprotein P n=1 Tax=Mastacembelus armatus TaxID=205130 RepID=A0A3Q3NEI4_9TELE
MVINHQGQQAQRLHAMLEQRLSENITLYKQDEQQPDVWKTLGGQKDDFLIYDRCGRLTHHISLPYSIIGQGHIESAIRDTYCNRILTAGVQPDGDGTPTVEEDTRHAHHHGHHHGHDHHGHHGNDNGFHPSGFDHGHNHNHGHHHGNHDAAGHDHGQSQHGIRHQGHEQDGGLPQRQQHVDLGQMPQILKMIQEVHAAPVKPFDRPR